MHCTHDDAAAVSPWVERWSKNVAAGGRVLDVACGSGRHSRLFAARGCKVTAIDRDEAARASLREQANIQFIAADIESGDWPLGAAQFDAVVVTKYLYRPRFATLLSALAPEAWLIYETFAAGNAQFGKPSNPEFLLRPRELLDVFGERLRVIAFEDGYSEHPKPAMIQRIAARNTEPRTPCAAELCRL